MSNAENGFAPGTWRIQGVISYDTDGCQRIILHDGEEEIDLVKEFQNASFENKGAEVQVNYWVTDKPCTKNEMLEGYLKQLAGAIDADYEDYYTGSWTYGCESSYGCYEEHGSLTIGGHDLFNELTNQDGQFIIIELNFRKAAPSHK